MKKLVKTMDEYSKDLISIASEEAIRKYHKYLADGNRIKAIQILKEYKLIE